MRIKDKDELRSIILDRIKNSTSNYINLNDLDVSGLTSMHELFNGIKEPNLTLDISKWDVSNVTDMRAMFEDSSFNGDISKWDTSKVTNMYDMFRNSPFNRNISKWNVSNVEKMGFMFRESPFNGDISKWNVSNVKNMVSMFQNSAFNGDISKWDTSNVRYMIYMFEKSNFTRDISGWNIANKDDLEEQIEENKLNIDKPKNELHLIEVVKERVEEAIANGKTSIDINDLDLSLIKDKEYKRFKEYLKTLLIPVELDNLNFPDDVKEEVNNIKLIGKYSIFLKE